MNIAKIVVVLDPELLDAGFVGVGRLQPRDHAAAFVAQASRFVERGHCARAYKPAVALEQRQIVSTGWLRDRARARRNWRAAGMALENLGRSPDAPRDAGG